MLHKTPPLTSIALCGTEIPLLKVGTNAGMMDFLYDGRSDFPAWVQEKLREVIYITSASSKVCGLSFPLSLDDISCFDIKGNSTVVHYSDGSSEPFPSASFDFAFNHLTDRQVSVIAGEVIDARQQILG